MSSVLINGYKGSIYAEGNGFTGVLDLGWTADGKRNRPKRKGRSKAIVKAKLMELAEDLDKKVTTSRAHTVRSVVTEYVDELERGGKAPSTIYTYRGVGQEPHHANRQDQDQGHATGTRVGMAGDAVGDAVAGGSSQGACLAHQQHQSRDRLPVRRRRRQAPGERSERLHGSTPAKRG
jgi:hypothetical protein